MSKILNMLMTFECKKMKYYYKKFRNGEINIEELKEAKKEGYLFDFPTYLEHDDILKQIKYFVSQISKKDVANAFLYSLTTRRLEYRSILGSYWYAVALFPHKKHNRYGTDGFCDICDWMDMPKDTPENEKKWYHYKYNIYNYDRYRVGGIVHTNVNYAMFDLREFLKMPKVEPTQKDKEILLKTLHLIDNLKLNNKAGTYRDYIVKNKIFPTNKNEITQFLNILGVCGVLSSDMYPCYDEHYVPADGSRDPVEYLNDFRYPLNRWKVADGINKKRFKKVFGFEYR